MWYTIGIVCQIRKCILWFRYIHYARSREIHLCRLTYFNEEKQQIFKVWLGHMNHAQHFTPLKLITRAPNVNFAVNCFFQTRDASLFVGVSCKMSCGMLGLRPHLFHMNFRNSYFDSIPLVSDKFSYGAERLQKYRTMKMSSCQHLSASGVIILEA